MADTGSIEKRCDSETCDVVFETRSKRRRFCCDRCRLEQWERDQGVTMRRVKVRRQRSGPPKPRTAWKVHYEEAVDAIGILIDELAATQALLAKRTKRRKR
jgi:hypothetical protein